MKHGKSSDRDMGTSSAEDLSLFQTLSPQERESMLFAMVEGLGSVYTAKDLETWAKSMQIDGELRDTFIDALKIKIATDGLHQIAQKKLASLGFLEAPDTFWDPLIECGLLDKDYIPNRIQHLEAAQLLREEMTRAVCQDSLAEVKKLLKQGTQPYWAVSSLELPHALHIDRFGPYQGNLREGMADVVDLSKVNFLELAIFLGCEKIVQRMLDASAEASVDVIKAFHVCRDISSFIIVAKNLNHPAFNSNGKELVDELTGLFRILVERPFIDFSSYGGGPAVADRITAAKILLVLGVDVNYIDCHGCSFLEYSSSPGMAANLIAKGANLAFVNSRGEYSAFRRVFDMFDEGLGSYCNQRDDLSMTQLPDDVVRKLFFEAIGRDLRLYHLEIISKWDESRIVERSSAILERSYTEALYFVINNASTPLDLDCFDDSGMTLLMIAADRGDGELVEALISVGANPTVVNSQGKTAAMIASQANHLVLSSHLEEDAYRWRMEEDTSLG